MAALDVKRVPVKASGLALAGLTFQTLGQFSTQSMLVDTDRLVNARRYLLRHWYLSSLRT
jgi:hypothetical protein